MGLAMGARRVEYHLPWTGARLGIATPPSDARTDAVEPCTHYRPPFCSWVERPIWIVNTSEGPEKRLDSSRVYKPSNPDMTLWIGEDKSHECGARGDPKLEV